MDNILIIGAGDFQLPLVQRASQSYNVYLAAPVISDMFKPYITGSLLIDVRDEKTILQFAREHSVCGVITDQTDIAVRSVAYVAENLGLPGIGYETGVLFTDKSLMRTRMAELGIKLLPNRTVSSLEEALSYYEEIGGDVIIKPLDTQGSRGVQICRSAADLRSKYAEAERWSSNRHVIVERYATGREFVVEGLAVDYEFRTTVIDQLHDESSFEAIGAWIRGAKRYFLQPFTDRDTVPFEGLSAPSKEKLQACAAAVSRYVGEVSIRGVD